MLIGCPTEIKTREYRVGMTPATCREAIAHGHRVMVQAGAGLGAGFRDEDYQAVGVELAETAEQVFAEAEMIVKVKEPQAAERKMLREGQVLFTYLHLAPDPGADEGPDRLGLHRDRLRDRDRRAGRAAAAGADVRGGRPPRAAGRRLGAAEGEWRARRSDGRRAGRGAGPRHGDRRRRRRHACGAHRRRHGRRTSRCSTARCRGCDISTTCSAAVQDALRLGAARPRSWCWNRTW